MTRQPAMELVRDKTDRRLYALGQTGTLRLEGLFGRGARAEAGADRWRISRSFWTRTITASDETGRLVGHFAGRSLSSGGTLVWAGREFTLRQTSIWGGHLALVRDDRVLARFEAKAWGRRPVRVRFEQPGELDPGLVLFVAFVARAAVDDTASTSAATTAATTGGS
jgi:hypothetical protein